MPCDKTTPNLRDNSCKHFNGFGRNETCEAGCNYLDMCGGVRDGLAIRLPCSGHFANEEVRAKHLGLVPIECPKFEKKTPEDIQKEHDALQAAIDRMTKIGPWISAQKKANHPRDRVVAEKCPICAGEIQFRISSYNGHMHAKCKTDDCINFME